MSNLLHKVKDAVTGHHHGKESKDSSKRQHGDTSGTGASEANPSYGSQEYASGTGAASTGEYGRTGAGHQGPTEYASQPAAGHEGYRTGQQGLGESAPGGSSYNAQPGSGQYTDTSKMGSQMESDPRHVGGTQQQRSQW